VRSVVDVADHVWAMPIDALHPTARETAWSTASHRQQQPFLLLRYKGSPANSCRSELCTGNFKDSVHKRLPSMQHVVKEKNT